MGKPRALEDMARGTPLTGPTAPGSEILKLKPNVFSILGRTLAIPNVAALGPDVHSLDGETSAADQDGTSLERCT